MESQRLMNASPSIPSPSMLAMNPGIPSQPITSGAVPNGVPAGYNVPVYNAPGYSASGYSAPIAPPVDEYTLDESVWTTIWRDVKTIGRNTICVLVPVNWKFSNRDAALRNWDLWGPLIFILMLAIILSWGETSPSQVFTLVFTEVGLGAVVLSLNVILLGGDIVFFQALCLLGYCLFPINIASIICTIFSNKFVRSAALIVGLGWSSWATIPFIGNAVPQMRRALAVYPVLLLYASIGWIALVK